MRYGKTVCTPACMSHAHGCACGMPILRHACAYAPLSLLCLFLVYIIYGYRIMSLVNPKIIWAEEGDQFWRRITFPEEDRPLHTSKPWDGGYRWFRSPNIVCLEQYRRRRKRR